MKPTREEFRAKWSHELYGLLLASFAEEKRTGDFTRDGRFMVQQMRRGADLLERIYDALPSEPLVPGTPSMPAEGSPKQPPDRNGRPPNPGR
jgi:hypothetical protein